MQQKLQQDKGQPKPQKHLQQHKQETKQKAKRIQNHKISKISGTTRIQQVYHPEELRKNYLIDSEEMGPGCAQKA